MSEEDPPQVGGPLTSEKLRTVALMLDLFDVVVDAWMTGRDPNVLPEDQQGILMDACSGDGVQRDLRRWADEIDAGQEPILFADARDPEAPSERFWRPS